MSIGSSLKPANAANAVSKNPNTIPGKQPSFNQLPNHETVDTTSSAEVEAGFPKHEIQEKTLTTHENGRLQHMERPQQGMPLEVV